MLAGLLLALVTAALGYRSGSKNAGRELGNFHSKVEQLRREASELQSQVHARDKRIQELEVSLRDQLKIIQDLKRQVADATRRQVQFQKQNTELQANLAGEHKKSALLRNQLTTANNQLEVMTDEAHKAESAGVQSSQRIAQLSHQRLEDQASLAQVRRQLEQATAERKPTGTPPPQIRAQGTLVWYGVAEPLDRIVIQGQSHSSGQLLGRLPEKPCSIQLSGTPAAVAVAPGPSNNWSRLELRVASRGFAVIRVDWSAR
jgi:hypothetical protein